MHAAPSVGQCVAWWWPPAGRYYDPFPDAGWGSEGAGDSQSHRAKEQLHRDQARVCLATHPTFFPPAWAAPRGAVRVGFLEGFLCETVDPGKQLSQGSRKTCPCPHRRPGSVPRGLADLVVDLGEGALAVELLPQLVVQGAVKHLPELLPVHVAVSIEHLEPMHTPDKLLQLSHAGTRIKVFHAWFPVCTDVDIELGLVPLGVHHARLAGQDEWAQPDGVDVDVIVEGV